MLNGNLDLDSQSAATEDLLAILETHSSRASTSPSPVRRSTSRRSTTTSRAECSRSARSRSVVMAVVLALMFRVRWRLLPLLAVHDRRDLDVLDPRVGRHRPLARDDLRAPDPDRARHRLRDPDPQPGRRGSRARPRPAPDRGDARQPGATADRRHRRRSRRLHGSATLEGADDPRLRGVARDRRRRCSVVGIIVPATTLGIREWSKPTEVRGPSLVEHIVVKLGGLPAKAGLGCSSHRCVLFVGGILVEGRTKIESDPIKWIDQNSDVVADVERLENETGFGTTLGVVVKANNVFEQEVDRLTRRSRSTPKRATRSCRRRARHHDGQDHRRSGATVIPPTEEDIVGLGGICPTRTTARTCARRGGSDREPGQPPAGAGQPRGASRARRRTQGRPRFPYQALDPAADSILLEGLPAGQDRYGHPGGPRDGRHRPAREPLVEPGRAHLPRAGLAGLWLVLRFRSFSRALLALVPVFLAVGASSLIVALLGIQLSPLTTVSGPLVIASCTEFSVLIFGRYSKSGSGTSRHEKPATRRHPAPGERSSRRRSPRSAASPS